MDLIGADISVVWIAENGREAQMCVIEISTSTKHTGPHLAESTGTFSQPDPNGDKLKPGALRSAECGLTCSLGSHRLYYHECASARQRDSVKCVPSRLLDVGAQIGGDSYRPPHNEQVHR